MNGNEDYDPDDDEDDSDDDDDTASDDNDDGPDDEPMELDGGEAGDTDDPMDAEESSTDDGVMVDPIDCPRCGHREDVPSLMREHMIKSCPARLVYILERPKGYHHTKKDKEEVPLLAALEGDPDRVLLLGVSMALPLSTSEHSSFRFIGQAARWCAQAAKNCGWTDPSTPSPSDA
ncbi:hypothetical protein DL93DRAFT_221375 [Clavulina sp. PMI_390]|nr:hypothetical protein DL93DRAFT_221375 [Clavulina sp. PMI_390]